MPGGEGLLCSITVLGHLPAFASFAHLHTQAAWGGEGCYASLHWATFPSFAHLCTLIPPAQCGRVVGRSAVGHRTACCLLCSARLFALFRCLLHTLLQALTRLDGTRQIDQRNPRPHCPTHQLSSITVACLPPSQIMATTTKQSRSLTRLLLLACAVMVMMAALPRGE